MWSAKFEVWSAKSAVCSVRCGVSREGHGRDRLSLNYRSFMFGKLPPPACPGLCYSEKSLQHDLTNNFVMSNHLQTVQKCLKYFSNVPNVSENVEMFPKPFQTNCGRIG